MTRVPRGLHPLAWWIWAAGLATAASETSQPVLLLLIIAAAAFVVAARRAVTPWSGSYAAFLRIALVVMVVRVALYVLLGDSGGSHVLVRLARLPLPTGWGVRIGGPLTAEGLVAAVEDGLRLGTVLVCIGAANTVASPARLLKALPGALYEVGVAVSVAVSFAPQSVVALARVRRARRLRGRGDRGLRAVRGMAVPVLEDALERSVDLAAAMDARGFGRRGNVPRRGRLTATTLTVVGLLSICAGSYGLLATGAPAALGIPLLLAGTGIAVAGFAVGNRASGRTRYRPDLWRLPEWSVAACGVVVATAYVVVAHQDPASLDAISQPLRTPDLPWALAVATFVAALPAWLAPPVPRATARPRSRKPIDKQALPPEPVGAAR
jgi:energy-coupling factor transport system permease protein